MGKGAKVIVAIPASEWREIESKFGTDNVARSIEVGMRVLKDSFKDEYAQWAKGDRLDWQSWAISMSKEFLSLLEEAQKAEWDKFKPKDKQTP